MLEIVNFEEKHLKDAAALAATRYRALRMQMPLAPARYEDVTILYPLLKDLASAAPGVAALRNDRLVGFLLAWMVPSWRGKASVFSPEWGNGADAADARRLYQALYTELSARWVADGYFAHFISVLGHDRDGIAGWQWLGFGYYVVDAIRSLEPAPGEASDVEIRRATPADLDIVLDLERALRRHLASAPIFLVQENEDRVDDMRIWLGNLSKTIWLAHRAGRPMAYLRLEGGNEEASTVIRDPGTISITGAFTVEQARGDGIATALLNQGLAWAQAQGYVRCAVDFEAMNVPAARFWLRHFQPICTSLHRHVNEFIQPDVRSQ